MEGNISRKRSKHHRVETPVSLSNTQVSLSSLASKVSLGDLQIASLWSDLPLDIANSVLDKLSEVVDQIRFGAVCKGWYTILKEYVESSRNVIPMLLVPSPDAHQTLLKSQPPLLVALSCLRKHCSNLQLHKHIKYIGTSHGWVAIQNLDFTFTLVYPFGREIQPIYLPPLKHWSWDSPLDVNKLVILFDSTPSDYTVVAIYRKRDEFAIIKSGEISWVHIDTHSPTLSNSLFEDIIFHQGAVYLVDHLSNIIKVDIHSRPPVIKQVHHLLEETELHKSYLVESTSSDLYLLQKFSHCICGYGRSRTFRFDIFKLEGEEFIAKKKSKGRKGDAFFIGDKNTSMAIKSLGCIPNSIYFIDKNCCVPYSKRSYVIANYSIEDGAVRSLYETKREGVSQPIWIVPHQHFAPSDKPLLHGFFVPRKFYLP